MGAALGLGFGWLILELLVWIGIAQFVSGWWVFLWIVAAFFIGGALLKSGMKNLNPMAQQMQQGGFVQPHTRPPDTVMTKSMALVVAGFLFVIPGVVSDVLALLVMLPPVQKKLKAYAESYMMKNQQKMQEMMLKRMQDMGMDPSQFGAGFGGDTGGSNPFGGQNPFGQGSPFGSNTGKAGGKFGGFGQTVDSSATVVKDKKKITHDAANDE